MYIINDECIVGNYSIVHYLKRSTPKNDSRDALRKINKLILTRFIIKLYLMKKPGFVYCLTFHICIQYNAAAIKAIHTLTIFYWFDTTLLARTYHFLAVESFYETHFPRER